MTEISRKIPLAVPRIPGSIVIACALSLSSPHAAWAMSGFSLGHAISQPDLRWLEDFKADMERPLHLDTGFSHAITMSGAVDSLLRDQGLHPFLEIRENREQTNRSRSLLPPALGVSSGDGGVKMLQFYLAGRRIVGFSIKAASLPATEYGSGARLSILGNIPRLDDDFGLESLQLSGDWPARERALDVALDTMRPGSGNDNADALRLTEGDAGSPVLSSEEVYIAGGTRLIPAWRFVVQIGTLPYEVVADDREVLAFNPQFFDATASARVFKTNKKEGTLADFSFTITDNQNNLTNQRFVTDIGYSGASRATVGAGNKFDFASGSQQFQEASVFAYANEHVDFLSAAGYSWNPTQPIVLYVGECYDPSECSKCASGSECSAKSNAVYIPADSRYTGSPPAIRVGEGDNILLKDLHMDSGVTSHEFGHHVVFSSITEYGEGTEALQLHEGLADALVMMRADSPCLGAGICPSGSRICYTNQCLRSADTDMTYGSAEYRVVKDHQRGQVISGFLWDLKEAGIANADVVKLTLGAIALLPSKASFGDLLAAVRKADDTLFASAHADIIELKSIARNINASPVTDALRDGKVAQKKSRKSSGNIFGCTMASPISSGIHVHPVGTTVDKPVVYGEFDTFLALLFAIPVALALKSLLRRMKRN